jgi:NTE family protein
MDMPAPERAPRRRAAARPAVRRINLALQGGGAHGAFTWGVLDRLLEDETIEIAAISGTSAGAINGAALKAGYLKGGRHGARAALDSLWTDIGGVSEFGFLRWVWAFWPGATSMARNWAATAGYPAVDLFTRVFSPYEVPQIGGHPLRPIAERLDFSSICENCLPHLFVSATNVRTGKIRVFTQGEVSADVLLASACLPTLFRAVELHDPATGRLEAFWDGGYTGNPALFPLFDKALPPDIVVVNINPLHREDLPRTAEEINNRINEISFNSSLIRELRAINFVKRLIADGSIAEGRMKDAYLHMISDDKLMNSLSVATKTFALPGMIAELKDAGRAAASRFLAEDGERIGQAGTLELERLFS